LIAPNKEQKPMKSIVWKHESWLENYVRLNLQIIIWRRNL